MGFNKLFIPNIDDLKKQLAAGGEDEFTNYWTARYSKADAILGSNESFEFLNRFILYGNENI